jgi:hypothetical protein
MAWQYKPVAMPGEYLLLTAVSGTNLDLLSTISPQEIQQRVLDAAQGWFPVSVRWERGIFSSNLRILGQATTSVDTASVAAEAAAAVNSFWSIFGTQINVLVSANASDPQPGEGPDWNVSIKWVAIAAVAIATAIIIVNIRKATT